MRYLPEKTIEYLEHNGYDAQRDHDCYQALKNYLKDEGHKKNLKDFSKNLLNDYMALIGMMEIRMEEMSLMSETDALTQVFNPMKIQNIIDLEWSRGKRYHSPLSLLLFEIDGWQEIIEAHGRDIGNQILIKLAEIIKTNIRTTDVLGRWYGEAFILVVPTTNNVQAEWLAQKLRKTIERTTFDTVGNITCSFGVADRDAAMDVDDWVVILEMALKKAKEKGRNLVIDYETIINEDE
ncbi:MAG: GGDEF domain-containing protein [Vallitaleaceae bacterium]|nr:GGDEF domain-containing protein [Vallitaleaceae bacterium]